MRITAAIALFALLAVARPAAADSKTTPTSTITQLSIISKSNPKHRRFHGALWLEFDKNQHVYRWGGLYCGGADLSELKVSMLFAAFRSKYSVNIEYKDHLYKGKRRRCVVGFTISR
ncbi:MAG: hypothetical protein KJO07_21770 [Deltaproteobacteria bacterium]|nr:hypothetical protein [Deltaproteobacteria bacterium]